MLAVLTSKGLAVPVESLTPAHYKELVKLCTLRYAPRIGQPIVAKIYHEITRELPDKRLQKVVYFPRGIAGELISRDVTIKCTLKPVARREIPAFTCELFPNQQIVVNALAVDLCDARIAQGTAISLLNLRAGMGKTFVAAALIHKLAMPTLYIVPTDYLAEQAINDLRGCFDKTLICRWDRQANKKLAKKNITLGTPLVTVIVINSALLEPPEFFHNFGFTVYDEVHTYCANKRREIFSRITWAALGMSATTDQRKDTFDTISHLHLTGATLPKWKSSVVMAETLQGFTMDDVKFESRVTVCKYKGPPEHTVTLIHPSTKLMFTPWMHKQFVADPHRTKVALCELDRLYKWVGPEGQHHRIFVFCEEREPLDELYKMLSGLFEVDAPELHEKVGSFIGGTKTAEIARVKQSARVILTTYGYSSTGISIVDMTAILFWTPRRSNMLQIIPRIRRRGGDLSITREIVDIVDWSTPMRSQYYERRNAYQYFDSEIEEKIVNCDELK